MGLSESDQTVLDRAQEMLKQAAEADIQKAHDVIALLSPTEAEAEAAAEAVIEQPAAEAAEAAAPAAEAAAPAA